MSDTLDETIESAAMTGISRVNVDGLSVDRVPIPDLIAAQEHLAKRTSRAKNHLGLTFRTLEPGGCG